MGLSFDASPIDDPSAKMLIARAIHSAFRVCEETGVRAEARMVLRGCPIDRG